MLHVLNMLLIVLKSEFSKVPYICLSYHGLILEKWCFFFRLECICHFEKRLMLKSPRRYMSLSFRFKLENFSIIKSMNSAWFGHL